MSCDNGQQRMEELANNYHNYADSGQSNAANIVLYEMKELIVVVSDEPRTPETCSDNSQKFK